MSTRAGPRGDYDEPDDGDWQDRAACAGMTDVMFPRTNELTEDNAGVYVQARRLCATCTVKAPCLAYALATNQQHGYWAGTTPTDRRRLRRAAWASAAPDQKRQARTGSHGARNTAAAAIYDVTVDEAIAAVWQRIVEETG